MAQPEFPYVAKCPVCASTGWDNNRMHKCRCGCGTMWPEDCRNCNGRGYVIPKEWTADVPT